MDDVKFPYKPKIAVFLLSTLFFAGCTLVLGNVALTNDRGLVLNGVIEFSTASATVFYWCLVAASGLFVVFGAIALYSGLTTKREIVLTGKEIVAPKSGISKKVVSVAFSEVTDLNILSVQKQRFLNICHQGGKLTIPQNMMPNKEAFDELADLVATRTKD